ncbi:MAG: YqaA family protein [Halobacteriales archaeon]
MAGLYELLLRGVETATGPAGLVVIWVYSFLIAFVLPLPSEVVLAAPLDLGLSTTGRLATIAVVSGFGKAVGSVVAFHIGQEVKSSGPVLRFLERHGYDVRAWSERQIVRLARRFGYGGLAIALSVPFFPDTVSIYAFAILERDYLRFALATFAGSVGRLLVTVFVVGGTLTIV